MTVVALVGMPGSGKSSVGRQLARRLNWGFADADAEIERQIGCAIRAYFEQHGEAAFRDVEQTVLASLLRREQMVLATGGGTVVREANRQLLAEHAEVVYLRSSPEELMRRLRHDTHRPLLQVSDPMRKVRDLFQERDPLYRECARFVIETGRPSVKILAGMILMQLELAGVIDPSQVPSPLAPDRRDS
ncbi:MAG TPA: shikimate kinase [Burkholderiaceae bacterium]|nr:shikimate kinase [Burkholderiaceae bacterium]